MAIGAGGEEGFSLAEVVFSFFMLLLVLVPTSLLVANVLKQDGEARSKVEGLSVAEKWLEALNANGPGYKGTIPTVDVPIGVGTDSSPGRTVTTGSSTVKFTTLAGTRYFAIGRFSWATTAAHRAPDVCTSGTVPRVLRLTVSVRWGANRIGSVSDTTLTDFPPAGLPKDGFIGVQIERSPTNPTDLSVPKDAATGPWGGAGTATTRVHSVPVTVTPTPSTRTLPSTVRPTTVNPVTNGCAFVERPPGRYLVSVGPETLSTAFVKPRSTTTAAYPYPTGPVTVALDQVTSIHFLYDEGAYVKVAYPDSTATAGGVMCSGPAQLCIATGESPTGPSPDGSTGTVPTVSVYSGSKWTTQLHPLRTMGISSIESVACTTSLCIGTGYGPLGAAAVTHAPSAPGTRWSPSPLSVPAGVTVTNLGQVTCPGPVTCLALGSGPTGTVLLVATVTASAGTATWTADPMPSETVTQLACAQPTACVAIGATSGGGGVILAGAPSTPGTWAWSPANGTLSLATTIPSRLACPGPSTCLAVGWGSSGAVILSGSRATGGGSWTWASDGVPSGTTSLSQLACPTATACMAGGAGPGGATIVSGAPTGVTGAWGWVADTLPAGTSPLAEVTCPGATACLAVESGSAGAHLLAAVPSAGPGGWPWVADSLPTGVSSLTALTCPGSTLCLATGSSSAGGPVIVAGASAGTAEAWSAGAMPSGLATGFVDGVACFQPPSGPGSGIACAAPGATSSGALLLDDLVTGPTGTAWTQPPVAPATATGVVAGGLAVSASSTTLPGFTACPSSPTDDCSAVGPVFPFTDGYSIGAGTCTAELNNGSVHAKSTPGTGSSLAPTVTLPLGLLPLKVVNASGQPVPGAKVRATVADPTHPSCSGATLTLGSTGQDGLLTVAVMYETYSLTVTSPVSGRSTTVTVKVSPASDATIAPSAQTFPLPTPVEVVT